MPTIVRVVVSRKGPETPVYDIKSESGRGKIIKLHRNLLLPCDYLPPQINEYKLTSRSKQRRVKQVNEEKS